MSATSDAVISAGRRLQILTALSLRPQYRAEPRNLRQELELTGYPMMLTKLAVECAYLAELGLVAVPESGLFQLTDDGLAVVRGLIKLPGIGSPEPGAL